uniref:Uncharacterized protein n=1 Tax=Alexandrium monilatum TaxID=311494 RepID=A0A7S4R4U5_9DINO
MAACWGGVLRRWPVFLALCALLAYALSIRQYLPGLSVLPEEQGVLESDGEEEAAQQQQPRLQEQPPPPPQPPPPHQQQQSVSPVAPYIPAEAREAIPQALRSPTLAATTSAALAAAAATSARVGVPGAASMAKAHARFVSCPA